MEEEGESKVVVGGKRDLGFFEGEAVKKEEKDELLS